MPRVSVGEFSARRSRRCIDLRQPEVQNFYGAVGLDLDVAGFQIAMHDALFVRGFQSVTYLRCDTQRLLKGVWTLGRLALDELHHQVVGADVVNLADVGMVQRRDGFGFALEAFAELRGGNFDGDVAIQPWIVRLPHFAHAALADRRKDFVGSEFVAGGKRHRRSSAKFSRSESRLDYGEKGDRARVVYRRDPQSGVCSGLPHPRSPAKPELCASSRAKSGDDTTGGRQSSPLFQHPLTLCTSGTGERRCR